MRKWNFYTTNEIKPLGWMKNQLQIQANGLSGNLDKMWPDVKESAWIGGNKEGWERVPYWLDGFIPLAYLLDDEDMKARAKKYIDAIIENQKPDGWLCPCEDNKRAEYDAWALMLISKVLVIWHDCSKDKRVYSVLYSALKNYYQMLLSGQTHLFEWAKSRWYETLIAVKFVYDRCNEPWLIDLAKLLKKQGADYNKFVWGWRIPQKKIWRHRDHIVNIAMMFKYEALYCELTGEPYENRAEKLRQILDKHHGTVFEGFTGDECLSGRKPIQGTELCSIAEQMYSYEHLFAYTGDEKWAERLEVLAFNALPATISDDMWTHQYDQMVNQIACEKLEGTPHFRTNSGESHLFGLEPNYGCCTANFNQAWPKLALSTFMYNEKMIVSAVPVPSALNCKTADITLETDYPFKNILTYTVKAKEDFCFLIRVPSFAENIRVNGAKRSRLEMMFVFKGGADEKIVVEYDVEPRFENRPNSLKAVKCGSLIFSVPVEFEQVQHEYTRDGVERKFPYCDYTLVPKSEWQYGYSSRELKLIQNDVNDVPFSSQNPPVTVEARVKKINWGTHKLHSTVCAAKPKSTTPISEEKNIKLYPYGCAKLRMTELPSVK